MTKNPPKVYIRTFSCTAQELLQGKLSPNVMGELNIPEYQRPYVWGSSEVQKLLNDFKEYQNIQTEKPQYYMGSVILHQEGNNFNIIDGQQRITTLGILSKLTSNDFLPKISFSSPISINNIQKNYNYLVSLKEIIHLNLNEINFTVILTSNPDDAYTFFETQNTGGIRLGGLDILKAHHLRCISTEDYRNDYAVQWEQQKKLKNVIAILIKARSWGYLDWKDVPKHNDQKNGRKTIIKEFSEDLKKEDGNFAYHFLVQEISNGSASLKLPTCYYSIRQPVSGGENFIEYFFSFSNIYRSLFISLKEKEIPNAYYDFRKSIIDEIDGTIYLKELFEIAMVCYVHKFGYEKIFEAALQIFRFTYAPRLRNKKTVREDTIPAFVKEKHIIDTIIYCYTHDELINRLKEFTYTYNDENTAKNSVKRRFLQRVKNFFELELDLDNPKSREQYDLILTQKLSSHYAI